MTRIYEPIRTTNDEFEAAIEILGGKIIRTPDYASSKIYARIDEYPGPDGPIEITIYATGLEFDAVDGFYYARSDAWSHTRIDQINSRGKGSQKLYSDANETAFSRLQKQLHEMLDE